jgi:hypothetical protein
LKAWTTNEGRSFRARVDAVLGVLPKPNTGKGYLKTFRTIRITQ